MAKKRRVEHRDGNVVYLNRPSKPERLVTRSRVAVVAALLAVAGGVWTVRGRDPEPVRESKDAGMTPEQRRMKESMWMFAMRLPEIGKFEPREWNVDGGQVEQGSKAALDGFRIRFDELGNEAEKKLAPLSDEMAREGVISDFLAKVIQAHKVAVGDRKSEKLQMGSQDFVRLVQGINDTLIPRGAYLHAQFDLDKKMRITRYEVDQRGEIRAGDKVVKVAKVHGVSSLTLRPGDPMAHLNGLYQSKINTAVLDQEGGDLELAGILEAYKIRCRRAGGIPRAFDEARMREDFRATGASHEAAHGALSWVDYEPGKSDALVRRGGIPMGAYDFPSEALAKVSNAQLHELFANGIGLMSSGTAAPVVAQAVVVGSNQPNYVLARDLIWREIVFCPELDAQVSHDLLRDINATQSIPFDRMIEAINRLSPEALHRIGERMAKAALYLMGK